MGVSIAELTTTAIVQDAVATNVIETDVRSGVTTLYGVYVDNTANTGLVYLKFWDAIGPVIGTTVTDMVLEIEGSTGGTNAGDVFIPINGGTGMVFANGLSFAVTTAPVHTDTGAPGSTVLVSLVTS